MQLSMTNRIQVYWYRQSPLWRFVVGMGLLWLLIYQGYCWGWWGRSSFLLQYLFQCTCPAVSEPIRYRPFTLLASGCEALELRSISPSKQSLLLVAEQPQARTVHISVETGVRQEVPLGDIPLHQHTDVGLLNDHLVLVRTVQRSTHYTFSVVDLRTGRRVTLPSVEAPTPLVAISPPPIGAATWRTVAQAQEVVVGYLTHVYVVVALPVDPIQFPHQSIVIYNGVFRGHEAMLGELRQRQIAFVPPVLAYLPTGYTNSETGRYTTDGRFRADEQGIVDMVARRWVVDFGFSIFAAQRLSPKGWVRDDQAVVYAHRQRYHYLIDSGPGGPITFQLFAVPQPIVLFELPKQ